MPTTINLPGDKENSYLENYKLCMGRWNLVDKIIKDLDR